MWCDERNTECGSVYTVRSFLCVGNTSNAMRFFLLDVVFALIYNIDMEPNTQKPKRFTTIEEAADELQVSYSTIYKLFKQGDIPHIRVGKSIRLLREWLDVKLVEGL